MLVLKNIKKSYKVAGEGILVLKGLNIAFRKNEFVSILGPSGCGKTTTLNIIGGLDKYTDGDLIISGISTKEFGDKEWDSYRNHRVGFVFQSYNLIPHQTILENVELALTIGGVSKEERKKRAREALDKVGLRGEYDKKPNQMSGGQCQRVAIARALVNNPEILLADEPTGALDTKTSIQIMDLIKEISKDTLVIMVTHNPELAEKYSNRIIRLLDGEVQEDSNPYSEEDEEKERKLLTIEEKERKNSKAKMSLLTAFKLSFKNLLSKKTRTILTCFAGSIGIIGISAVLAVSNGVQTYIGDMQNDMLSGNPITISENGYDLQALMSMMSTSEQKQFISKDGYINVDSMIEYLADRFSSLSSAEISNDISPEYIKYVSSMPSDYYAEISLDYGINLSNNIYTKFVGEGSVEKELSISGITSTYTKLLGHTDFSSYASLVTSLEDYMKQAPSNNDYVLSQYDIKAGKIASEKNEIMIVLDENNALSDLILAELGYYTQEEFMNIAYKATSHESYSSSLDKDMFSYEEILGKEFTYYPNDVVFNDNTSNPYSPFSYNYQNTGFTDGLSLEVVGILTPKDSVSYGCLSTGLYYTDELTKYSIESNISSVISNYIRNSENDSIASLEYNGVNTGIYYNLEYVYDSVSYNEVAFVGSSNSMSSIMGSTEAYTISLRELGGYDIASKISIYPTSFDTKDKVLAYLDVWNSDLDITIDGVVLTSQMRSEIKYQDTLSLIIALINNMISLVTTALIAFTALSLVVSCVMIAIITYVSVVERVKEIGVIRSLGGRKKDVTHLFNAETIMIGLVSGVVGVGITYFISLILNVIVKHFAGISKIAILAPSTALIMILLSILLTVISGVIPSLKAAKLDPANALRSE